ncbi:hypothetical protein AIN02nite_01530 [Acetobacter indonesiensis]|uniref:Uncharacterized protein n=1 Tax=Acetobacter indonesiensis TaxID=104101 RepID=A0A6N3T245_9PROT|nr:hypothetical protein AIN02nite_01530 [Acetobacter indonesiensis]
MGFWCVFLADQNPKKPVRSDATGFFYEQILTLSDASKSRCYQRPDSGKGCGKVGFCRFAASGIGGYQKGRV